MRTLLIVAALFFSSIAFSQNKTQTFTLNVKGREFAYFKYTNPFDVDAHAKVLVHYYASKIDKDPYFTETLGRHYIRYADGRDRRWRLNRNVDKPEQVKIVIQWFKL